MERAGRAEPHEHGGRGWVGDAQRVSHHQASQFVRTRGGEQLHHGASQASVVGARLILVHTPAHTERRLPPWQRPPSTVLRPLRGSCAVQTKPQASVRGSLNPIREIRPRQRTRRAADVVLR